MRVVSLIASATEIVTALGCESNLVGRSHECDYPESIKKLPIVTETKFAADGTSYQIDQRIKAILQEGLSVYRVKASLLKELQPEVILTQTQCEVCAVSLKDVEMATCSWLESHPKIVSLHPNSLEDLWKDICKVAQALNIPQKGESLILQLQNRIQFLHQDCLNQLKSRKRKPRVACIEWLAPLMAAGNWVPELVELAGGENLLGEAGKHSPWMDWDQLVRLNPDIIVIMPCGFDIARIQSELFNLTGHPLWKTLSAVQSSQVYLVDGNQFFNRPGPRLVESLEILGEIFYRDPSREKWKGTGWCLA